MCILPLTLEETFENSFSRFCYIHYNINSRNKEKNVRFFFQIYHHSIKKRQLLSKPSFSLKNPYLTCFANSSWAFLLDSSFSFSHFSLAFSYSSFVTVLSCTLRYLYDSTPLLPANENGLERNCFSQCWCSA